MNIYWSVHFRGCLLAMSLCNISVSAGILEFTYVAVSVTSSMDSKLMGNDTVLPLI